MIKKFFHLINKISARIGNRFILVLIALTALTTLAGAIWLAVITRQESTTPPPPIAEQKDDCSTCHTEIYAGWHKGAHGDTKSEDALAQGTNCLACHQDASTISLNTGGSNPSFEDYWVKNGMPNNCGSCHLTGYDQATNTWKSEGIGCENCHGVIPTNHPDAAVVTIDKSGENCRTCHTDARFDWGKWKDSVHFQESIACVDCHNPHTTSLKITGETHGAPSQLCGNCHQQLAETSEHSTHADIGVTCIDCHLGEPKGNDAFHQMPDHDFNAKIETCNKCHENQMHFAGKAKITDELLLSSTTSIGERELAKVENKPQTDLLPRSAGFVVVAVLFGVIGGTTLRKSVRRTKR